MALHAGLLASSLVVLVVVHIRDVLVCKYQEATSFNSLKTVVLFSALWALALFPGCVIFGSAIPMEPVRVCGAGNAYNLPGFLIGETNDRIYVGEQRASDRRILAIPWDRTEAVFIGSPNISGLCERVRPTETPPPDPYANFCDWVARKSDMAASPAVKLRDRLGARTISMDLAPLFPGTA